MDHAEKVKSLLSFLQSASGITHIGFKEGYNSKGVTTPVQSYIASVGEDTCSIDLETETLKIRIDVFTPSKTGGKNCLNTTHAICNAIKKWDEYPLVKSVAIGALSYYSNARAFNQTAILTLSETVDGGTAANCIASVLYNGNVLAVGRAASVSAAIAGHEIKTFGQSKPVAVVNESESSIITVRGLSYTGSNDLPFAGLEIQLDYGDYVEIYTNSRLIKRELSDTAEKLVFTSSSRKRVAKAAGQTISQNIGPVEEQADEQIEQAADQGDNENDGEAEA